MIKEYKTSSVEIKYIILILNLKLTLHCKYKISLSSLLCKYNIDGLCNQFHHNYSLCTTQKKCKN